SHFDEHHVLDGVVMSAFWAFIVGRLLYVILNMSIFWNHFSRIFLFSNFPGIDKWGVLLGIYIGIFWTVRRVKAKMIDWMDLVSLGSLAGAAIFYGGLAWLTISWLYIVVGIVGLIIFIFLWDAEDKYRTYSWYKGNKTSAKSGLITGLTLSCWGLMSLIEGLLLRRVTAGLLIWAGLLFVGGMVLVYIRSGRTASEDIKTILKHGRK
ncbi:MAG: hypothetical protein ACD_61C00297G0001, partial [uncultured bacterium]